MKTIIHHINSPWEWAEKEQGYYFCENPNCDVVYFGEDNSVITKSGLRTVVGIKECKPEALTCYCFGVSNLYFSNNKCAIYRSLFSERFGLRSIEAAKKWGQQNNT